MRSRPLHERVKLKNPHPKGVGLSKPQRGFVYLVVKDDQVTEPTAIQFISALVDAARFVDLFCLDISRKPSPRLYQ